VRLVDDIVVEEPVWMGAQDVRMLGRLRDRLGW
jgi:hypothetical protein